MSALDRLVSSLARKKAREKKTKKKKSVRRPSSAARAKTARDPATR
jgi:hypothetical protein